MQHTEYANDYLQVMRDPANGHTYVKKPGTEEGAAILLIWRGRIALVEQYRTPLRRRVLEIPRGLAKAGEDALSCALREGFEETGLLARRENTVLLGRIAPDTAVLAYEVDCYLGIVDDASTQKAHDEEIDRCVLLELKSLKEEIRQGRITDSFTLGGVMLAEGKYREWLKQQGQRISVYV